MKKFHYSFIIALISVSVSFAQQSNFDEDLVKKRAELNAAKADLEEARQKRDMAVAARWEDREAANEERELFNEKYRENKEKVDALMVERSRLQEDVRVGREDLSQVKAATEQARSEFLSLSAQQDLLEPLQRYRDQGVQFHIPERMENFNRVKKEIELYRDDPLRVAQKILDLSKKELLFTREIEWKKGELLFGNKVAYGNQLRLGGIFAMQEAEPDGPVALMLPLAGEKGQVYSWQENLAPEVKASLKTAFASSKDSARIMIPVDVLLSTVLSSELANQTEQSLFNRLKAFMHDGGILMWPIAALLIFGLILVIERFLFLSIKSYTIRYRFVINLCEIGKIEDARKKAKKLRGSVGKVIQAALLKQYSSRAEAEKAIEEVFAAETPAIERGLSSISIMASTAPLLGLLGTVMGMIELFQVITMHGTSDPKLLAGGISIALITTEAGLMVAIPLQLCHTFLGNKADKIIGRMEKAGLAVLNAIWIKG
jgi:biopolymer transport protein ExbB